MKMHVWIMAAVVSIACAGASAQVTKDKVTDVYTPADFTQQQLEGLLGDRMTINEQKRLLNVDEVGILEGFQHRPGKQAWIGEHVGKFLHAASNAWLYDRDPKLKEKMDRVAREFMATQLADGYLGTYTDDKRWTSWDVWVHKYDLIGLLRYYDVTHDPSALEASRKIGDLLWRTFGDGQQGTNLGKDISYDGDKLGQQNGMAETSILEPMCYLYQHTGEQRYLDFCYYITRSMDNSSKVITSLTVTKKVFGTANNKAYEMLSNLLGLTMLYRITGDEKFLIPAENAWQDIVDNRLYVTGTTSEHELFQDDQYLPAGDGDEIGEGCVTVTWTQLNLSLLRLTGNVKYADQMERSIYNHLLGAQNTDDGNVCYYMALVGQKHPTPGISCCVSSVPRGIALIPNIMWGSLNGGIAINLYNAGKATIPVSADGKAEDVEVTCDTKLPADGHVTLSFKSNHPIRFPLFVRIPAWAGEVAIPGATKDSGYERVEIDLAKSSSLSFVLEPRTKVLEGGKSYPNSIGLERGPQVLCLDVPKNGDLLLPALAAFADPEPVLKPLPDGSGYTTDGLVDVIDPTTHQFRTEKHELTMIPFMDAKVPRVWLPKADTLPTGPAPVTFGGTESQSRPGRPGEGSFTDLRWDTYKSTRDNNTAKEDWYAVEIAAPAKISRVVYCHGSTSPDGGWFDSSAGKPRIEYKATADGEWKLLGTLDDYPATTAKTTPDIPNGQNFELKLKKEPVSVIAIRVIGKPAVGRRAVRSFTTCAELQAYEQ